MLGATLLAICVGGFLRGIYESGYAATAVLAAQSW
jgi:hypothetical protein